MGDKNLMSEVLGGVSKVRIGEGLPKLYGRGEKAGVAENRRTITSVQRREKKKKTSEGEPSHLTMFQFFRWVWGKKENWRDT